MAGKNTTAFGIYRTQADVEYAVDPLRAEGFCNLSANRHSKTLFSGPSRMKALALTIGLAAYRIACIAFGARVQ